MFESGLHVYPSNFLIPLHNALPVDFEVSSSALLEKVGSSDRAVGAGNAGPRRGHPVVLMASAESASGTLSALALSAEAIKTTGCPLLGPAFPAPTALSEDPTCVVETEC
jgi:hypothetical protein